MDTTTLASEGAHVAGQLRDQNDATASLRLVTADANERLMDLYVCGSERAFDQLHRRLAPSLLGYLMRLTRNREDAEDLLQVTFMKLHGARGRYRRGAGVKPWLFVIARNSFLDALRSKHTRLEMLTGDGEIENRDGSDGERRIIEADLVSYALGALPTRYREAIALTKLSGLSCSEAAQMLGTTTNAVKLRVHRGYAHLRRGTSGWM